MNGVQVVLHLMWQAVLERPSNKETKPDDDSVKSQYAERLGHFKGHISQ